MSLTDANYDYAHSVFKFQVFNADFLGKCLTTNPQQISARSHSSFGAVRHHRQSKLYANDDVASHAKNKLKQQEGEILKRVPQFVLPHLAQGNIINYKQATGTEEAALLPQLQRDAQE